MTTFKVELDDKIKFTVLDEEDSAIGTLTITSSGTINYQPECEKSSFCRSAKVLQDFFEQYDSIVVEPLPF